MKVETIYSPGDTVWAMINNKPVETKTTIHYFEDGQYKRDSATNPETKIEDYFGWELEAIERGYMGVNFNARRKEDQLYRTKQELINSL